MPVGVGMGLTRATPKNLDLGSSNKSKRLVRERGPRTVGIVHFGVIWSHFGVSEAILVPKSYFEKYFF